MPAYVTRDSENGAGPNTDGKGTVPVYAARDSENGAGPNADGKREVPAYAARDSESGAGLNRTGGKSMGKGRGGSDYTARQDIKRAGILLPCEGSECGKRDRERMEISHDGFDDTGNCPGLRRDAGGTGRKGGW